MVTFMCFEEFFENESSLSISHKIIKVGEKSVPRFEWTGTVYVVLNFYVLENI